MKHEAVVWTPLKIAYIRVLFLKKKKKLQLVLSLITRVLIKRDMVITCLFFIIRINVENIIRLNFYTY